MTTRRWFAAVCVGVLAALAAAPGASAHAVLIGTTPGNDSVLERSPELVELRFNEPVETAFGSVRVYDSTARRVDAGDVVRPNDKTVAAPIDERLARGTYTVTWRAISADAHPVSGAFVFHVGAPGTRPEGIASEVLGGGTPRIVTALYTAARFLDFALLLLVAGGTAALVAVLGAAAGDVRLRLFRLIACFAGGLIVVAFAGIVLQGAAAGGFGLRDALRWDVVSAVLDTRFGKVWLAQAAWQRWSSSLALARRREAFLPAAALVVTPSLAGHASVSGKLAFVADVAHVAAAAAWTGRLAFLVLGLVLARHERGRWRPLLCRVSRTWPWGPWQSCSSRASSTATSRSGHGVGSGTRPTACSCSARSHSSYRCSCSGSTTTGTPSRDCAARSRPWPSSGGSCGWRAPNLPS